MLPGVASDIIIRQRLPFSPMIGAMPNSNKRAVRARSRSVKHRRLGAAVLPELRSEVMREMFFIGSQTRAPGLSMISAGVVNGTARSARKEVMPAISSARKRSA